MHRGQKDYRRPEVMAAGVLTQRQRRGGVDHEYVVGLFVLEQGRVILRAIERGPAWDVREDVLTDLAPSFARWRTKQAAWQWLIKRPRLADCRVIHLGRLDVLSRPAVGN